MISFLFQLAALDLNSADVQGVTGSEYLFNSAAEVLDEVMLCVCHANRVCSSPGRYIPPHLRNKEASKNGTYTCCCLPCETRSHLEQKLNDKV